ncbi:hypothetical protein A2380_00935 [candidate division WWE3 bacterium RIFOXYB1_FULL_43_24]|uniref:Uncharacterized protein n=1 Tax=candidate division WWE3 bacterium GW2011_GWF1_42_14 TaxID=1619138 RepID=A0A0G0YRI4_UNCKA|nr:MAG: hypothetical protein UU92_C0005G0104 [candidate division WWE3 bacterium GW2011_GWA1_42_12]KKS34158.1 MAG: hypothetical protein UU97_C0014G0009 [candidate division WWE3 bacterium GW2011_GWD1_42_14]KKS39272.1 MAG: hypothetical protein UV00_C0003G0104 [candidate division WWE3 bacterium GW2011_GWF1_42_14]KKS40770.1 MAG: hypothetical protein UV03_C0003G0083 [candidate division WWE3 bacterium GW2011_GWE1_42_16]OGC60101.1 MAG: hypothetical protein A2212_00315 [candidate division WWE3 bacterium
MINMLCVLGLALIIGGLFALSSFSEWLYKRIRPGIPEEEKAYDSYLRKLYLPDEDGYDPHCDPESLVYDPLAWERRERERQAAGWRYNKARESRREYEQTIKGHPELKNIYYDLKFQFMEENVSTAEKNKLNRLHRWEREKAVELSEYPEYPDKYREWVKRYPYATSDFSEFLYKRALLKEQEAAEWRPVGNTFIIIFLIVGLAAFVLMVLWSLRL